MQQILRIRVHRTAIQSTFIIYNLSEMGKISLLFYVSLYVGLTISFVKN